LKFNTAGYLELQDTTVQRLMRKWWLSMHSLFRKESL